MANAVRPPTIPRSLAAVEVPTIAERLGAMMFIRDSTYAKICKRYGSVYVEVTHSATGVPAHLISSLLQLLCGLAAAFDRLPLGIRENPAPSSRCRHRDRHDDSRTKDTLEGNLGEVGGVAEAEHSVHVRPGVRDELLELRKPGRVMIADELEKE